MTSRKISVGWQNPTGMAICQKKIISGIWIVSFFFFTHLCKQHCRKESLWVSFILNGKEIAWSTLVPCVVECVVIISERKRDTKIKQTWSLHEPTHWREVQKLVLWILSDTVEIIIYVCLVPHRINQFPGKTCQISPQHSLLLYKPYNTATESLPHFTKAAGHRPEGLWTSARPSWQSEASIQHQHTCSHPYLCSSLGIFPCW